MNRRSGRETHDAVRRRACSLPTILWEVANVSTLLYGAVTRKREEAESGKSTNEKPPGLSTYVDALAALVPAEVLALHAVVISRSTTTVQGATTITAPEQLRFWFWFLLIAAGA